MKKLSAALVLALLVGALALAGCNQNQAVNGGSGDSSTPAQSSQEVAESFLKAVKEVDAETINALCVSNDTTKEAIASLADANNQDLKALLYENLDYTVNSVEENGNTAVAKVTLRVPDYQQVGKDYARSTARMVIDMAKNGTEMSEDEKNAKLIETLQGLLDSGSYEQMEIQVDLPLQQSANQWKIAPDDAFFNSVTGQFFAAATGEDVSEEINQMAQELIDSLSQAQQ